MKIEINVPTRLNEITLEQYQRFMKISQSNPDGNFLNAKMIEIFCGIPLSESYKLKMSSVVSIVDILTKMLSEKPEHIEHFTMDGVKYGFIPDLEEMSLGEYIDLDNSITDWSKMHIAMNVLYRPIKDIKSNLYNIVPYDIKGAEQMKQMPLDCAISSLFFFYNLGIELSRDTILSSLNQSNNKDIPDEMLSTINGVGTIQFSHYLEEILRDLKISLN